VVSLPITLPLSQVASGTVVHVAIANPIALAHPAPTCEILATVTGRSGSHILASWTPGQLPDPGRWQELEFESRPEAPTLSLTLTPTSACETTPLLTAIGEFRPRMSVVEAAPPNVILIAVEALRRDTLDCADQSQLLLPLVHARLCEHGSYFEDAIATAPKTAPSLASMLTGLLPDQLTLQPRSNAGFELRPEIHTAPELLRLSGYETLAYVAPPEAGRSLSRGFDRFQEFFGASGDTTAETGRTSHLVDSALDALGTGRPAPYFMLLVANGLAPAELRTSSLKHAPPECTDVGLMPRTFDAAKPNSQQREDERLRACRHAHYRDGLKQLDRELDRLLGAVARTPQGDNTVVFLVATAGDPRWDEWMRQRPLPPGESPGTSRIGALLHQEFVRIPWLILPPEPRPISGTRIAALASGADLFVSLLGFARVPPPTSQTGVDWSAPSTGTAPRGHDQVVSTSIANQGFNLALTTSLMRAIKAETTELQVFDRRVDPLELTPLPANALLYRDAQRLVARAMRGAINYSAPSAADLEALKLLGYVR